MIEDDQKINIRKYKRHERKIPWALIRKIVIALVLIGLVVYLNHTLNAKKSDENAIEIELQ